MSVRTFAIAALCAAVCIPLFTHAEVIGSQWNDSDTIEFPGGDNEPPVQDDSLDDEFPQDEEDEGGSEEGGGSAGESGSSGGGSGGSSGSGSGSSGSGGDVLIFGSSSSGSGSSSGSSGSGGSGEEGSETSAEALLETLTAAGAVSLSGSGSSGGSNGVSGSGQTTVKVNGDKVRQALAGKGTLRVGLRLGVAGGSSFASDLGLVAASTALSDQNLAEASFAAGRFEIVYRARGYLLAFLPITFPVRVAVDPDAGSVTVRYPWYSFILRTFIGKNELAASIRAVLDTDRAEATPGEDQLLRQTRLFTKVAAHLALRLDVVEGSVLEKPAR